ncbi:MAG: SGNH/GDSL hydrolase family protein [Comamonadaceae bacterium]|nr:SGNH/GDSL hydrolase family protein [Comamonadaceae bacterium]
MKHLVLLGDSIFDNAAYVANGLPVIQQVNSQLPGNWQATLLANDGDTTIYVAQQVTCLPPDTTHLALSIGGNDALGCIAKLEAPAATVKQGLIALTEIKREFEANSRGLLLQLIALKKPLMVFTIYDHVPGLPPELKTALALFNDVILRAAIRYGLPVLDLRMVCTEADDYSEISPIEPSEQGGAKLATRLVAVVMAHDFLWGGCRVYV